MSFIFEAEVSIHINNVIVSQWIILSDLKRDIKKSDPRYFEHRLLQCEYVRMYAPGSREKGVKKKAKKDVKFRFMISVKD